MKSLSLILWTRRPNIILKRLEIDGTYLSNKKLDMVSSEFLLKRVKSLYLRNANIQVYDKEFCFINEQHYLTEFRIGAGTTIISSE